MVCGLNPVIHKIYSEHLFTVNCIEKTKIKKMRPGKDDLKKADFAQEPWFNGYDWETLFLRFCRLYV